MADPSEWSLIYPVIASDRASEVAAILRSWKDRDPRELWSDCRAKGWGELETVEEVAGFAVTEGWAVMGQDSFRPVRTNRPASNQDTPERLASRVLAVARWLVAGYWSRPGQEAFSEAAAGLRDDWAGSDTNAIASRLSPWPVPLRCHHGSCLDVPVVKDARGFYVYFDGSYKHPDGTPTTGYKENIYAEDAREYLMAWSEAGAVVAVSDARPLDWLFPGWKTLRIDGERIGQKRTFSKQSAEWLTLNREPAWTPGVQVPLFTPASPGGR